MNVDAVDQRTGNFVEVFLNETLADRITVYRIENGLSCEKMANLLGAHATTVRSWETNKSIPKLGVAKRLKELLEC